MISSITAYLRAYAKWLVPAVAFVFGLEELRILFVGFVGLLRDSMGVDSLDLAPIAIGIFALSFLAGPLNRLAGTRNALWISAGGLAVLRVAEQLVQSPIIDLYLSAGAVVLFLIYIAIAIGVARNQGNAAVADLGLASLLGMSMGTAILLAADTLDLSWHTGLVASGFVVLLATGMLFTLTKLPAGVQAADGSWRSNLATLVIGLWLFLELQLIQSPAYLSSMVGWHTPSAGVFLTLGNALGVYMAATLAAPRRGWFSVVVVGGLTALCLTFLKPNGGAVGSFLFVGQILSMSLGMLIFMAAGRVQGKPGLGKTTLLNGIGNIFMVLFLFIYYASYDIDFGFRSGVLPYVALGLIVLFTGIASTAKPSESKTAERDYAPSRLAAAFLIVPLVMLFGYKTYPATTAEAGTKTVHVTNYNLHEGTDAAGRVDPGALVDVIKATNPDILGLQEVSRGWLVAGGMDMLEWMAQRLEMPFYVWDATADAQWGMAVFSRYPITGVEYHNLPPEDIQFLRDFTLVTVDVAGTPLTVVNTHFSEKDSQDEIRLVQSSAILDVLNNGVWAEQGQTTTIVMGDFNALPDSEAVKLLLDAGLVDISREIGQQPVYTYSSVKPEYQIDYIFVTPDLGYSDFYIPISQASDHLPLVTTIELP